MRYSSIHSMIFGRLNGSPVKLKHLFIAAALGSSLFGLRPALATEEGDGSLYRVPGEGPPYVPYYAPRADWPPMPDRRPYSHGRRDEGFGPGPEPVTREIHEERIVHPGRHEEHDEERIVHPASHEEHDEPEHAHVTRGYEEHDEGHARHEQGDAEAFHDYGYESGPYSQNYPDGDGGKSDGFGRLFPAVRSHSELPALTALGRAMVEQGEPDDPAGDTETPAGYTYFGQFIDHDITFDATSQLGRETRGDDQLVNARTPELDLDNVYGNGPARSPYLYRLPYIRAGRQISADGDLPRADLFRTKSAHYYGPAGGEAVALIGDPRDDENIIVSQLHAAFIAFHNRTADILVERDFGHDRWSYCKSGAPCDTQELAEALPDNAKLKIFETAHDHVIHYYHRIIAEDFLPRIIGPDYTAAFLKHGRAFYFPDGFRDGGGHFRKPYIPLEFSGAAYRFGHSQVRDAYHLREGATFDLLTDEQGGPHAFQPVTPRFLLDWRYFFDIGHDKPDGFNYARKIDPELVRSLHRLNFSNAVGRRELGSLAARNLVRGQTLHLPSGQDVAEQILPVLQQRGLIGQGGYGPRAGGHGEGWRAYVLPPSDQVRYFLGNAETPLWYYVLQEASVFGPRVRPYSEPYGHHDEVISDGDFRPYRDRGAYHNASIRYAEGGGDHYRRGNDGAEGGYTLGPVGRTIVGEVLTGLLEEYRETTGKGLDYRPEIRGSVSGGRYTMSNFLVDAGVADPYWPENR